MGLAPSIRSTLKQVIGGVQRSSRAHTRPFDARLPGSPGVEQHIVELIPYGSLGGIEARVRFPKISPVEVTVSSIRLRFRHQPLPGYTNGAVRMESGSTSPAEGGYDTDAAKRVCSHRGFLAT